MRKAFLAPWHPLVPRVWLYSMADAQRNTGVAVHHGICVVTHEHVMVTPERNNLPDFTRRFHHDVSCALNTLLCQERYDAPRDLFDKRDCHYMRLLDAPAQATQFCYDRNNCVAAGLVDRPEHMPGDFFDFDLWKVGYIEVERPPVYFNSSRPQRLRLLLTPPPLLLLAFGGDLDRLIYHMKRLTESAGRALRAARTRPALGARRVLRLHPWSEPRTLREPGGHRVPTFRIGARGIDGRKTAAAAALETRQFRHDHQRIRLARREGDPTARFPFGTYAWDVYHRAPVEPAPKPGALVTQPGPLLCDVQLQLEAMQLETRQQLHRQSLQLLDESRAAFDDESAELVADDHLDFERDEPSSVISTPAEATGEPRPKRAVAHRHRFEPDPRNGFQGVRRIVILRDARRGRPPARPTRHGADPPR